MAYEEAVKQAFKEAAYNERMLNSFPLKEAVYIRVLAVFKVPIATKDKREQMLYGEILPTKKPDCDNIAKIICDALNGVAYDDDKQIVQLLVSKVYSVEPFVLVTISDERIF